MTTVKCPYCAEEIRAEAIKCKHCGTWIQAPPSRSAPSSSADGPWAPAGWAEPLGSGTNWVPFEPPPAANGLFRFTSRRLVRPRSGRMLGGVCAGLARYFDLEPTLVRILYVFLAFFTAIVPGLVLYLILAIVMPPDDRVAS